MDAISGGIDKRWRYEDQEMLFRAGSGLARKQPVQHRYVTQDWSLASEVLYIRLIHQAHEQKRDATSRQFGAAFAPGSRKHPRA